MAGSLGINVAGRSEQQPAAIAALGARWARAVAYPDANITAWAHGCHDRGVRVLLVLASESIGQDPNGWEARITAYRDRYGSVVDAWQLGNESDHVSPSSWTMSHADLNRLLKVGRQVLGFNAYIVGPGLVSGQPQWATGVDWSPVNALAVHPYAKEPNTPALRDMLIAYHQATPDKALWVTEYNARTIGMAAYLRDFPGLDAALAFCYSNSMVPGFGLIEDRVALADFKTAAGETTVPDKFLVGPGMLALMAERGDAPASDEIYFKNRDGRDQFSEAAGASGRLYRYIRSTGQTYSYAPEP